MNKVYSLIFMLCICLIANAQPFTFIVAPDGSGTDLTVQSAIDKCPDNVRSIIFVKNGTYYGQTYIGTKAAPSSKIISLIGEDPEKVILTYDKSLNMVSTFEEATTFQIYAKDFYAENITFKNTAGNTGQALALYTAGDKQTFKNCRMLGYQDTYRSKKGTRGYFKNCWIEGAVDFIYAGGVEFFDDCTINCVNGGGYISAPEDAYATIPKLQTTIGQFIRIGFFFRNCNITANNDVADNSYYLGRPWAAYAGSVYLNCKLGKHIKAAGWKEWSGNETTAFFAEYNSMDANGNTLDVSGRVSWSYQLPKEDVDNLLTPQAIYARVSSTLYDPITLCVSPAAPENIRLESGKIVWDAVSNVLGYLVYKNGLFHAALTETPFSDSEDITNIAVYTLYSINADGVLSAPATISTKLGNVPESNVKTEIYKERIIFSEPVYFNLYSVSGETVISSSDKLSDNCPIANIAKGIYVLKYIDGNSKIKIQKIHLY